MEKPTNNVGSVFSGVNRGPQVFFFATGGTHSFDILYVTVFDLFILQSVFTDLSLCVHRERVLSSSKVLACCCCYCPRCGEDNTLTLENVLIVLNLCIRHTERRCVIKQTEKRSEGFLPFCVQFPFVKHLPTFHSLSSMRRRPAIEHLNFEA